MDVRHSHRIRGAKSGDRQSATAGENDRVDVPAYALSAYDAVYLALAIRLELASAAKDGPLVEAARRAGIAFA